MKSKDQLLTPEEIQAIEESLTAIGKPPDFWLLKIHLCFLITTAMTLIILFYPEQLLDWLLFSDDGERSDVMSMLRVRSFLLIAVILTGYLAYRFAADVKTVLAVFLAILVSDSLLDIPVFYTYKILDFSADLALIVSLRLILIYCVASVWRRAEHLPSAPRAFFANPFRRRPFEHEVDNTQ